MSFDLTPGEDLRQILDAAQAMLDSHYPVARLQEGMGGDDLDPLEDFGAFALALPEDAGGAGFSIVEEAHLHVALGRHLVGPGALASAIARRLDAGVTACIGVASNGTWTLVDPEGADHAVIRVDGGFGLSPVTDPKTTAPLGAGLPVAKMARTGTNRPVDADLARLLAAAQLLGVATGARDLAVDYAKIREQFGQPIGTFQAIKHHTANMTLGIEMVSALLDMAAIALCDGHPDAGFQVAALTRLAPRVALDNARTGIQIHGGIGFSAEANAHLFLKQAHVLAQFIGPADLLSLPAPLAPYGDNA
ncbi:acyl-CoA dehydrogenase-like protein [Maritimibacter alkaliphilus HTCC2654]|uniref:Putative acyl-CoA dehydrogenase n=1 Tax=Maritimibacter alkaliphilus HTCC2654 TaxID=314271 RepID=A3VG75_9RHOB|nr:acyl-CoA dehydrogenase family protein [Maritimibacter alkaliphilus]EAQ12851.1 putative acyl-CoA dehydrogenase [Rhodobacterales bacterium HTCC2654] [Maritimibacter alkaliphilus HTCC2654]TYP85756.1 acyl-CoA dehydrogenase-like protein [Maritimibacter alkaliphilus HTCC2654]